MYAILAPPLAWNNFRESKREEEASSYNILHFEELVAGILLMWPCAVHLFDMPVPEHQY